MEVSISLNIYLYIYVFKVNRKSYIYISSFIRRSSHKDNETMHKKYNVNLMNLIKTLLAKRAVLLNESWS